MNLTARNKTAHSGYVVTEWEEYARLHAAVTTTVQLNLYREACTHLRGDVVDLGCGTAKIAPLLIDSPDVSSYTGVDFAAGMAMVARQVVGSLGRENFSVKQCKIEDIREQYHSAVSIQSYYSWPDPVATLRHISSFLRHKSTFVLATPNPYLSIEQVIREAQKELLAHPDFEDFKRHNLQLAHNPDANFIAMNDLVMQVQKAGFELLECHQKHFEGGINFLVLYKD